MYQAKFVNKVAILKFENDEAWSNLGDFNTILFLDQERTTFLQHGELFIEQWP